MSALLARLRGGLLARNTSWMVLGHGSRTLIQAVYFVIIARALGPEGYGTFVAVVALAYVVVPFAGWGSGSLLVRDVALDPARFARCWGNVLVAILVSGILLVGVVVLASRLLLPSAPLLLALSIAVSDLLLARVVDGAGQAFQAVQRLRRTAQLQVWMSGFRLLAAVALGVLVSSPDPVHWGAGYLLSSAAAAAVALALVHRELGPPRPGGRVERGEMAQGFYFSAGHATHAVHTGADKVLLARLASLPAAGVYGVAYRVADMAFVPVLALLNASYARFFRTGAEGIGGSLRLAARLLPPATAYAAAAGVGVFLAAPLLPRLLGAEYAEAAQALRWLAVLPLLRSWQYLGGDTLTGAGRQGARTALQAGAACMGVLLGLWLIPAHSWRGAAWAALASEAVLVLAVWATVAHLARREGALRGARPDLVPSLAR